MGAAFSSPPGGAIVGSGKVQIFGVPPSGNCIPCVLMCLDYNCGGLEMCNIMEGAHKTPDMLAINPFHQIPSMKDGDICLAECDAILRHIARNYANAAYPSTDLKKLAVLDWALSWDSTGLTTNFKDIWYPVAGFGPAPADQKAANAAMTVNLTDFTNKFLSGGNKFIGGTVLSVADYKTGTKIWYMNHAAIKAANGFELSPRLKQYADDWFNALSPAARAFMTAKGDSPFTSPDHYMNSKMKK